MISFFHFLLVGFYQRPALQDKGSTQNVGSIEEIKKVNLEPPFFPYFNSHTYVKGRGTSSAFDTSRGQESRAYQQKSCGLKWFILSFSLTYGLSFCPEHTKAHVMHNASRPSRRPPP